MLSKLNIEKPSKILKDYEDLLLIFYNIAFVYLSVILWIVSSTLHLPSNFIFVIYFSGQFLIPLIVFKHQEFASVLILFFQCLVFF